VHSIENLKPKGMNRFQCLFQNQACPQLPHFKRRDARLVGKFLTSQPHEFVDAKLMLSAKFRDAHLSVGPAGRNGN
jgi:hypothetical protein